MIKIGNQVTNFKGLFCKFAAEGFESEEERRKKRHGHWCKI
jgi:hypothetical protein